MNDRVAVVDPEVAVAALDTAYAGFLDAFRDVPDAAFSFVPDGEEYALGILPEHLCDPLWSYSSQLDAMLRCEFEPLNLSGDRPLEAANQQRHAWLAAWRPTSADRAGMFARLETAHQHARSRLAALDGATFTRTAPVTYTTVGEPLPTSPRDIVGWLSAHYDEHTEQTRSLLTRWRTG
jgi:hypothetical protein